MILTCPRCATHYVVGEDQVGPQGRKVKCAACGERWMALPEVEAPPQPPPEPYVVAPPEMEQAIVAAIEPPAPPPQDELREQMRKRAKRRQTGGRTVLWAGVATLVTVAVAAVVFRAEISRAWPFAARGYAAMGLAVR